MDEENPLMGMVLIVLLIILSAVFAAVKEAIRHFNEGNISKKAENGHKGAKTLLLIMDKPVIYRTALEFISGSIGIMMGMQWLITLQCLNSLEWGGAIPRWIYYCCFTLLLLFLYILLGQILPKKIGVRHADSIAPGAVGLLKLLGFLLHPVAWLLDQLMKLIFRMFGVKASELEENVTEEGIISLVNEGQEQGVLDAEEVERISNIIELDEMEAQDIMTHKKNIIAVHTGMTLEEALHFMLSEKYTRYPLYDGSMDNIIGILHLKDVSSAYISNESKNKSLEEIARDPYFVPDSQNINILFKEMQSKNIHMAIVIDEYGQTAGLVAMEDFLEEIVGNIQDEYDVEESMVLATDENSVTVKGSISLEELEEELDISLHNEDYDTLNGLLISLLDRIPVDGESATLTYQGYQFDILETRNKVTEVVRILKLPEEETDTDEINVSATN